MKNFLIFILLTTMSAFASANQQIEYTVHHAPGGVSDRAARLITKDLPASEYIVQNRPGGAGRLAVRHILKTNSVLLATVSQIFVTNPITFTDLEYNPDTDLEIIGTVGIMTNLLICNSKTEIKSIASLIDTKKSLSFATSGYGSSDHLATELLLTRLKGKHVIVPYGSGGNKSALDVLGGSVDCTFGNYATIKPFIKDEKITVLFASHNMGDNVLTWDQYFKETFPYQSFISLVVSKEMNAETKAKVIRDVKSIWERKEFREQTYNLGILPILSTDSASTNLVLRSNKSLKKFILNNNIPVSQ